MYALPDKQLVGALYKERKNLPVLQVRLQRLFGRQNPKDDTYLGPGFVGVFPTVAE
jgi:hypothetical protein